MLTLGPRRRRLAPSLLVGSVLLLLATGLAGPLTTARGSPTLAPLAVHIAHGPVEKHHPPIWFPPRRAPSYPQPFGVDPTAHYTGEPAPMGIADFGVNQNLTPYSYVTTEFLGTAAIRSLTTYNSSISGTGCGNNDQVGLQYNVVLTFSSGGIPYAYWIQDVAIVSTSTNVIDFVNNIWNLSNGGGMNLQSNSVTGNGTISSSSYGSFYYTSTNGQPGAGATLSYPTSVGLRLLTNASSGVPKVYFQYSDGYGWQGFDVASFGWTHSALDSFFSVDGTVNAYSYLYYNAELAFTGPGCGTSTALTAGNVTLSMEYWNGHNLQGIPEAWDLGSNTGETISNVVESRSVNTTTGFLGAHLTKGAGTVGVLYDNGYSAFLNGSAPRFPKGSYSVNGTIEGTYSGGELNLTLPPGSYTIGLWVSSSLVASASIHLARGQYLPYDFTPIPSWTVAFSETGLPLYATWSVLVDGTARSASTATIDFTIPNGTHNYTIEPIAGYQANVTHGTFTMAGGNLSFLVGWGPVTYTVLATEAGLPGGASWGLTVGGVDHASTLSAFTFTLTNGTYAYTVDVVAGFRPVLTHGWIFVNGAETSVSVTFTGILYGVSFEESGLPANAAWYLTIDGRNLSSGTSAIGTSLANGTYLYSVWDPAPYLASPADGNLTVTGSTVTVQVRFSPAPATLTGVLLPITAEIKVNGTAVPVTDGSYTITLPPGTYTVQVTAPGYAALSTNVTISAGQQLSKNFTLDRSPSSSSIGSSFGGLGSPYVLLGLVAVAAAAALGAVAYLATRRRR